MPYLIDGHNLIGKMPDIHLKDLDDETALIEYLEIFFKKIRKKAIIFFDRGQPGGNNQISLAFVQARFVLQPEIADQAIINFLRSKRGEAHNFTVISSDNAVRSTAKHIGARLMKSQEFIRFLNGNEKITTEKAGDSENDVDFWLKRFQDGS